MRAWGLKPGLVTYCLRSPELDMLNYIITQAIIGAPSREFAIFFEARWVANGGELGTDRYERFVHKFGIEFVDLEPPEVPVAERYAQWDGNEALVWNQEMVALPDWQRRCPVYCWPFPDSGTCYDTY